MMQQSVKDFISILNDAPLLKVGRAADVAWFCFGEELKDIDVYGKEIIKYSLSLHLQCPWRLVDGIQKQVLFASHDIYVPNTSAEWDEDFNWDVQGINLFDEKAKNWVNANGGLYVANIDYLYGDLVVTFSNQNYLEVFINSTSDVECWRFLKYKINHLVQTGQKIEIV